MSPAPLMHWRGQRGPSQLNGARGALEPGFGECVVVRIDAGGADVSGFYARTLDRQPDGKLIVGCSSALAGTNRPMVVRVNTRCSG